MSLRILYVDNSLASFFAFRSELADAVQELGCEVHVAAPPDSAISLAQERGIFFHPIQMSRKGINPLTEFGAVCELQKLYAVLRPDLIQHFRLKPVLYGGLAGRFAGSPPCVHLVTGLGHIFTENTFRTRSVRAAVMLGCRWIFSPRQTKVIFQNPDDLQLFLDRRSVAREKTTLIRGSGVDTKVFRFSPEPSGAPVVVMPSRMLKDKGVYAFVEAARLLRSQNIECRMVLVGETDPGNPSAVPRRQLETWNEEGTVEWWGHSTNMPSVFQAAHIVCLPSLREGVPKCLLEGAACGRPIVTTDVPGCREIVKHDFNGFLVRVDDPVGIATALQTLIRNPGLRRIMGARSHSRAVSEFSIEQVISATLEIYRELIPRPLADTTFGRTRAAAVGSPLT